jgi:hypothetical protein
MARMQARDDRSISCVHCASHAMSINHTVLAATMSGLPPTGTQQYSIQSPVTAMCHARSLAAARHTPLLSYDSYHA